MPQPNLQGTDPTQREELPQPSLNVFLHRLVLSLAAGLAIACQAQTLSPNTSSTPPLQASPSVGQLTSQPNITPSAAASGQLTYRSDRGFTFEYPAGFVTSNSTESSSLTSEQPVAIVEVWSWADAEALPSRQGQGTELPPNITVSVHSNPDQRDLQAWASTNNWFVTPTEFTNVTVAGERAIAFQSTGLYEFENIAVPTPDGKHIILISLAEGHESYPEAFQQIVSTFQFTANP